VSNNEEHGERRIVGFLGVGLDNKDGHQRITQNEHFLIVGGSGATHEHMQDTAIRFTRALRNRGKVLEETSLEEVIEIFHETRAKKPRKGDR
jgi:hypothetical protein